MLFERPGWALLGVVALALVTGGALFGGFGTDDPDSEALVTDVIDGDSVEAITGTRTTTIEIQRVDDDEPRVTALTEEVWIRPPDQQRREIVSSDRNDLAGGDVRVINGSTLKTYYEDENRMQVDDEWEYGTQRIDAPPLMDDFETEYVRTETVADRETYVVEITPATNASRAALTLYFADDEFTVATVEPDDEGNVSHTTTWWIDAETGHPLKERLETEHENPRDHMREYRVRTTVYEDVTFDAEFDDETFTIDPPEDTWVHGTPEGLNVSTIEEADEIAPFAVPEPPISDRFELQMTVSTTFEGTYFFSFLYRDGDDSFEGDALTLRFTDRDPELLYEDWEVVSGGIGEVDGKVVDLDRPTFVYYCDDVRYELQPDLDVDDEIGYVVDVAESMGCP